MTIVMTIFLNSSFRAIVDHGGSAGFTSGNGNMANNFENTAGKLLELPMTVT